MQQHNRAEAQYVNRMSSTVAMPSLQFQDDLRHGGKKVRHLLTEIHAVWRCDGSRGMSPNGTDVGLA
jgi:hypothetical protein